MCACVRVRYLQGRRCVASAPRVRDSPTRAVAWYASPVLSPRLTLIRYVRLTYGWHSARDRGYPLYPSNVNIGAVSCWAERDAGALAEEAQHCFAPIIVNLPAAVLRLILPPSPLDIDPRFDFPRRSTKSRVARGTVLLRFRSNVVGKRSHANGRVHEDRPQRSITTVITRFKFVAAWNSRIALASY